MSFENLLSKIKNKDLRKMTETILNQFEKEITSLPASLSSQNHNGETQLTHIAQVIEYCELLSIEFDVKNSDKDVLLTSAMLHDISNCLYYTKEQNPQQHQKLYVTGYYRSEEAYLYHPTLSAFIIGKYIVENKLDDPLFFKVAKLVQSHMSHWLQEQNVQPNSVLEFILCTADFLATQKKVSR